MKTRNSSMDVKNDGFNAISKREPRPRKVPSKTVQCSGAQHRCHKQHCFMQPELLTVIDKKISHMDFKLRKANRRSEIELTKNLALASLGGRTWRGLYIQLACFLPVIACTPFSKLVSIAATLLPYMSCFSARD